ADHACQGDGDKDEYLGLGIIEIQQRDQRPPTARGEHSHRKKKPHLAIVLLRLRALDPQRVKNPDAHDMAGLEDEKPEDDLDIRLMKPDGQRSQGNRCGVWPAGNLALLEHIVDLLISDGQGHRRTSSTVDSFFCYVLPDVTAAISRGGR